LSANILAIDLETVCDVKDCKGFGTVCSEQHPLSPWHSRITVIGVYGEINGKTEKQVFRSLDAFRSYLDSTLPMVSLIGHNFKFDLLHLHARGFDIDLAKWAGDSQLAAYVLTDKIPDQWLADYEDKRRQLKGQRKAGKHSLKTLAPYWLNVQPFWETEDKDNDEYVLKDVEYTYRLYAILIGELKRRGEYEFYKQKQLPWAKLLLRAEMRGITLDLTALEEMEQELTQKAKALKLELDEQWRSAHYAHRDLAVDEIQTRYHQMAMKAGFECLTASPRYTRLCRAAMEKLPNKVDYDSPKQMLWLLRDYYGYDCTSLEGKDGTGREILERLANEGKTDVKKFLEWRKINKILTAFLPTYKSLQVGGLIRPIFNPDSTRTGRTSSERPNLQQVPPALRRVFRARQNYAFVGYDASAIEAKLIALYTSDPSLYDVVNSGASLHDVNTKIFFGLGPDVPLEDIKTKYANERATTKNVGFALFYGAGANRIRITFANKGYHLSDYECKEILNRFRETYQSAFEFNTMIVREMEQGAVMPNLLGRPIKIENPEDAYMTAFNTLVQSSASDLNLEAARRTQEEYDTKGIDAHVVGFVHDFVMVEAHDNVRDQAEKILVKHMTGFDLQCELGPIGLTVEGGQMKRWEK
jgi:DNA polymerase I-like protein with 3'-5' exonuclease and polymerase domains